MSNESKERMTVMSQQIKNINKKIEIIKKSRIEIPGQKSPIPKWKIHLRA